MICLFSYEIVYLFTFVIGSHHTSTSFFSVFNHSSLFIRWTYMGKLHQPVKIF